MTVVTVYCRIENRILPNQSLILCMLASQHVVLFLARRFIVYLFALVGSSESTLRPHNILALSIGQQPVVAHTTRLPWFDGHRVPSVVLTIVVMDGGDHQL